MQTSQGVWVCRTTWNQIPEISHAETVLTEDKMQVLTCLFSAVLYCSLLFGFVLSKGIFLFSLSQVYALQAYRGHHSFLTEERWNYTAEGKASFSDCANKQHFSWFGRICCGLMWLFISWRSFSPHFPFWGERRNEAKGMIACCSVPGSVEESFGSSTTFLTMHRCCKESFFCGGQTLLCHGDSEGLSWFKWKSKGQEFSRGPQGDLLRNFSCVMNDHSHVETVTVSQGPLS